MKRFVLPTVLGLAMLAGSGSIAAADDCDDDVVVYRSHQSYPARGYALTGYYAPSYSYRTAYYEDDYYYGYSYAPRVSYYYDTNPYFGFRSIYYDRPYYGYRSVAYDGGLRRSYRRSYQNVGLTGVRGYRSGTGMRAGVVRAGLGHGGRPGGGRNR